MTQPTNRICFIADPQRPGLAQAISGEAIIAAEKAGLPIYGTLAGCVLYAGVQASAFDGPISSEPVWDGARIIANGWRTAGLAPDGTRARYKVVAVPGQALLHPPLLPGDARLGAF